MLQVLLDETRLLKLNLFLANDAVAILKLILTQHPLVRVLLDLVLLGMDSSLQSQAHCLDRALLLLLL